MTSTTTTISPHFPFISATPSRQQLVICMCVVISCVMMLKPFSLFFLWDSSPPKLLSYKRWYWKILSKSFIVCLSSYSFFTGTHRNSKCFLIIYRHSMLSAILLVSPCFYFHLYYISIVLLRSPFFFLVSPWVFRSYCAIFRFWNLARMRRVRSCGITLLFIQWHCRRRAQKI